MKLTTENYDVAGFKLSRLARLLLVLRIHSVGTLELRVGFKDLILNLGKLWVQHCFKSDSFVVTRAVSLFRRSVNVFRRVMGKFKRN